jgi:hypothetical protein
MVRTLTCRRTVTYMDSTDSVLIRDQLLSVLLAARDTVRLPLSCQIASNLMDMQTACLLTFVTYFMAIYPDIAKRLRSEVLEHCGAQGAPTYEQIRNMKYSTFLVTFSLTALICILSASRHQRGPPSLPPCASECERDASRTLYIACLGFFVCEPRSSTLLHARLHDYNVSTAAHATQPSTLGPRRRRLRP